jgi:hypothetical protein
MEIKPNVIAMEILAYLAYETVAQVQSLLSVQLLPLISTPATMGCLLIPPATPAGMRTANVFF